MIFFPGAVALAGVQPGLWAIKGGNNQLCHKMLEKSQANLIKAKVTKVSPAQDGSNQFIVSSIVEGVIQNR